MANFKHDRPTVGILAGWSDLEGATPDHYRGTIFRGMQSAARVRHCDLLLSWGVGRGLATSNIFPAWPELSVDSDFVPVGPWNTDGLIVFAPLRADARSEYLQRVIAGGFPVLFIASGENGPSVAVNNADGIHQAVAHLVGHGHRRIAFIAGAPDDLGDSEQRLLAFRSAVAEYDLDKDPRLIVPGWHNVPGGRDAMQAILRSGADFTAVVASNDNCAIGAMQVLHEAGVRIPHDVAIVGFDDQPDAMAQLPPLASVHVPLKAIGEQALVAMLDHLNHGTPLESLPMPTRYMPRRSCGCLSEAVLSSADSMSHLLAIPADKTTTRGAHLASIKRMVVNEMMAAMPSETRLLDEDRTQRICTSLVDAFYKSLMDGTRSEFEAALIRFLDEIESVDGNMDSWQQIISVLRREMSRLVSKREFAKRQQLAEDLLHQARAVISESVQRQDRRHLFQRETQALQLSVATARLIATLDVHGAIKELESRMPDVGIQHGRVIFTEPEREDPVAWSNVLSADPDSPRLRFRSREFPPPGLYPPDELLNLVLLPLSFQNENMGYVVFDATNLEPCGSLARQLASTFNTAQLHAEVVELSLTDPLTSLHNRRYFDLFLNNEVDRSRRFGRGLAIIMIDIDHFKNYNDAFGHPAGDVALQIVAQCLQMGRRSVDVVARLGGEEFGIILPETDTAGTLQVAERIRASVAGLTNLKRQITISLGVTSVSMLGAFFADTMIHQADSALYEAKRRGRNQVCVFEEKPIQAGDATD